MLRIACLLLMLLASLPLAAQTFNISEIRVDGLQRISEGTVFSFLPVEVGDEMTPALGRAAIRDLYRTGFFSDVSLAREGDILIIEVQERPAIADITISGNRQIPTDNLMPVLAEIGISEGEVFNQQALDQIRQEMVRQYFSQGRYAVDVDARVTDLPRNRVNIRIQVEEGDQSRIRHINIVGNETFSEDDLREDFESDTKRGLMFWQGKTNYTREKLAGDLERLRAYYLDRGYVDFAIESTQVSISPDRSDISITANIREGEVYTVSDVDLTGELILAEDSLREFVRLEPGDTFSRRKIEETVDNITALLANIGYAFANVNPVPRVDRDNNEVAINFFVEPGKRVYVRRVEFRGNTRSKDEVLRREMRQFEGAWFSQAAIDRSRLRLRRLGYFEEVNIETPQVEGTDDQIDVIVNVEERSSGSFQVGLGYSQLQGVITSISVQQDNFLGSGRNIGVSVSRSSIYNQASINYNNPYYTDDGVSRGFFLRYTEFDQQSANISAFSTSQAAAGVNFGFPLSELDFFRFGASAQRLDINIGQLDFISDDPDDDDSPVTPVIIATRPLAVSLDRNNDGFLFSSERRINTYRLDGTWSRDSRNHFLNPTRGSLNRLNVEVAVPGSTREFYRAQYRFRNYWPIIGEVALGLRGDLAYGDSYDGEDSPVEATEPERLNGNCRLDEIVTRDQGLPFWEHFFGGGVSDIRGFDDNTLGPKDQFCRAVGGDLKVSGGLEVGFPLPFADVSGTRMSLFVDVGNVYQDIDAFEPDLLRASAGISMTWESPMGPLIINLAQPIIEREGDETQFLQFSFGGQF